MLMRHYGISTVLDVGANEGQYARELRLARYRGRIVSFEPLPDAFARLEAAARSDPKWITARLALGDASSEAQIRVSANSISSSLLPQTDTHLRAAINAEVVATTPVTVRRLDEVFDEYVPPGEKTYLKIDVQGFELKVLEGSTGVLDRIAGMQIEMSLVRLYEGGPLYDEIVDWAKGHGFALMGIEPGFADHASGRLYQVDGIFYRE
jgi:FkbM family methyltransferase